MTGYVNSIQSLGGADGPGIRFTVFLQGCRLRCGCCHNPDTWQEKAAKEYTALEIAKKAERYKEYFNEKGGITLSGGEPLLQAEFSREIFSLCKERGINTCLDTSGSVMNQSVKELLAATDTVLLDIKYTQEEQYRSYVGCELEAVLDFLRYLDQKSIPTVIRQVIIPGLNDTEENIRKLASLKASYGCVEKIELLPFRKLCSGKYQNLSIPFRFEDIPEPAAKKMEHLRELLKKL
ncbi:MAG: pyruvate formate lyase-activating protein [Ruminococcaceae bacterium]|nr:pyruvate formate lyase-activating protein [Oscillospiraceae bacterium]